MAIERTVAELKAILRDIILEVGELKERVALLESAVEKRADEAFETRFMAGQSGSTEEPQVEAETIALLTGADQSDHPSLYQIYLEGHHVCPMAFGEERSEGCLFCTAMLARGEL